ncbi:hypothetical protein RJ639_017919 [Escallonia herrerae]|uniref:Transcriptional adapter n=1 Tax=Escallonia herrerae TaxID=1293975 RepID=A0AA88V602_9ASTE|nr:hypothetical protein RJ639_017919 [Escallonia herrerae]
MGRSRGNFQADEDPSQSVCLDCYILHYTFVLCRSRRKKNASTGETLESATAGQGTSEGKKALYHCNYCNKDITGKIRIKCAVCPDFDLCIECFSVGAEVKPHKSHHPYRVMDNLAFPLICPDWNADEEMLLLEGIEMYGMGNWVEIFEHVGTKSKEACIEHYTSAYMNSPYFPLPDMSHVVGKNRKELLAMAKGQGEDKKGISALGELKLKDESPFSPSRVKIEDSVKGGPSGRLLSSSTTDRDSRDRFNSTNSIGTAAGKKASNMAQIKDGPDSVKLEDHLSGRNFGVNKPKSSRDEGPSLMEFSGYNSKRQEFDPEYDNDAEQLLADMEFKDTDTEDERELKLRVLRIYSKRLDERKRRKDFILERNLLRQNSFEKDLSQEEKNICRRYDVFMRFHSKEEHEELLKTVISEHRILKRIRELKEARAAGCHSSADADRYIEQKKKREAEESERKKESAQVGPSQGGANVPMSSESVGTYSQQANSGTLADFDTPGSDLLSESVISADQLCLTVVILHYQEKRMCSEINITPPQYLRMQEVISREILCGNITKKSDAYSFFNIEPAKIDTVYDVLVRKGIAQV